MSSKPTHYIIDYDDSVFVKKEHLCAITFYNFRRGFTLQQCINKLNPIFGDEAPSGPIFIDGLVISTEVIVHTKTNFEKVV